MTPEQFNEIIREVIKEELAPVKKDIQNSKNEILDAVDVVVKRLDNVETELLSNLKAHDRFEERITKLEDVTKTQMVFRK